MFGQKFIYQIYWILWHEINPYFASVMGIWQANSLQNIQ